VAPLALLSACLVALLVGSAPAQSARPAGKARGRPGVTPGLVTPAADRAINSGLAWLATRQHPDGSFGSGRSFRHNVAVTSLAGMAFLAGGHTPGRGRYGPQVTRAVDAVLESAQPSGYIIREPYVSHGPMYGHGFATLFLAEVHGMDARPEARKRVRVVLKRAVDLIVRTQNKEGGWRYEPRPVRAADLSVTVCQIMALRAARNSGIAVPRETVDRCTAFVKRCQNADGGFRYLPSRRESLFAVSAAGLVALASAGVYEGPEVEKGVSFLMRFVPARGDNPRRFDHFFYGHYYAVQAMWQAGDPGWQRWYPAIRDMLVARQQQTGSWKDRVCNEYGTAMACLVLQTPNSYLPIFQR